MTRFVAFAVAWVTAGGLAALGVELSPQDWGARLFAETGFSRDGSVSCMTCHVAGAGDGESRSGIPVRTDGRAVTVRNSPSLVDALPVPTETMLFHYDGEFASSEALVKETFLGRNFGWTPDERGEAIRQFSRVARRDPAADLWCNAGDEAVLDAAVHAVVAFLRTLRFSRDAEGLHNGSAYDAFLIANRLSRAPRPGQSAAEYGAKLGEQAASLRVPRFISASGRSHGFGELELQGMRIFFRSAIGPAQRSGAGNCAECHVPPHFTDFKFHNTGSAQDEYDAVHGLGTFATLEVPVLERRNADPERWLPPSTAHPPAPGRWLSSTTADRPGQADLGVWNVYANPFLPAPQAALERLLNPSGSLSPDAVLALTLARFKTTTVRGLDRTAPYLHTGHVLTIEDAILFYQRMSDLARDGRMRNAPHEYFGMRLATEDVAPLAAFVRALNETTSGK